MSATTIKIENPLLGELKKFVSQRETLSSFIRKVLEKEVKRRKMIEAAELYSKFLAEHPSEQKWIEEWEKADLLSPPQPNPKTRKKLYEKG